jgi:hypothetical protein
LENFAGRPNSSPSLPVIYQDRRLVEIRGDYGKGRATVVDEEMRGGSSWLALLASIIPMLILAGVKLTASFTYTGVLIAATARLINPRLRFTALGCFLCQWIKGSRVKGSQSW